MVYGSDLAMVGCKYLGTPYTTMDCQAFVERCLRDLGLKKDLAGSNAWYREVMAHGWVGSPEECTKKYGRIPKGAFLFILQQDGKEPAKYQGDGIGNASHIGIYTGLSGNDMVKQAKLEGDAIAGGYNYGDGAINSSSSRGAVCTSKFSGKSISGGWNRIGIWNQVLYDSISNGGGGSEVIHTMIVHTDNGGSLNLREQPSKSSGIITTIPNGTPVGVIDTTQDWSKLDYSGLNGWVRSCFLQEPAPDPDGQVIVPRDELQKVYDLIGDWLGLRG